MTKDEFEAGYALRSHLTLEKLHELGLYAVTCACGEDGCEGWQMTSVGQDGAGLLKGREKMSAKDRSGALIYMEVPLATVLADYSKGLKAMAGTEIFGVESLVDATKGIVIFKVFTRSVGEG
ncbi:MAG: hypothetical protein Q7O66_07295 [Dehalococcoidia bacterium]|nr:hypothetical protein [Dehalococcoidia bacterium]